MLKIITNPEATAMYNRGASLAKLNSTSQDDYRPVTALYGNLRLEVTPTKQWVIQVVGNGQSVRVAVLEGHPVAVVRTLDAANQIEAAVNNQGYARCTLPDGTVTADYTLQNCFNKALDKLHSAAKTV